MKLKISSDIFHSVLCVSSHSRFDNNGASKLQRYRIEHTIPSEVWQCNGVFFSFFPTSPRFWQLIWIYCTYSYNYLHSATAYLRRYRLRKMESTVHFQSINACWMGHQITHPECDGEWIYIYIYIFFRHSWWQHRKYTTIGNIAFTIHPFGLPLENVRFYHLHFALWQWEMETLRESNERIAALATTEETHRNSENWILNGMNGANDSEFPSFFFCSCCFYTLRTQWMMKIDRDSEKGWRRRGMRWMKNENVLAMMTFSIFIRFCAPSIYDVPELRMERWWMSHDK